MIANCIRNHLAYYVVHCYTIIDKEERIVLMDTRKEERIVLMDNSLQNYHDRIRRLMEGVNKLQQSVQSFANGLGIDSSEELSPNAQSIVDNIDVSQFNAVQPTETVENFNDIRQDVQDISEIVNGIDIDELMANVNTEAMIP